MEEKILEEKTKEIGRRDDFLSDHVFFKLTETSFIDLLFINGCIGYAAEDPVEEKSVVKSETSVQTNIKRKTHFGTNLAQADVVGFSSQVTEKDLFDEYNVNKKEEIDLTERILILSRILASNVCKPIQETLKKYENDPTAHDVQFWYLIIEVGKLTDERLVSSEISCLARNPAIEHLYAAGFFENHTGGVAIISMKNRMKAEKIHRLKDPVNCLNFSKVSPNLLAVGTKKGNMWVFDVGGKSIKVMHSVPGQSFDMVRVIDWWDNSIIWNTGSRIIRQERTFLTSKPQTVMTISYPSFKDIDEIVPLTLGPNISGLLQHPTKSNEYVVSGTDGALRYCSLNNTLDVQELIPDAHMEVISGIKPIPHCPKMFITYGYDATVKLWAWAQQEALIILKTEDKVLEICDTSWSPSHATVVAGCSKHKIFVWDIRRRTHAPISVKDTTYSCLTLQFSANGDFLIIGTEEGSIAYLGLGEMPFPEKLKTTAFRDTIIRQLITTGQTEILEKLIKSEIFV